MISGNPSIIVEDMFGKTPKTSNAVDVILRPLIHHLFGMINGVILT
jgi:hypothetical protein